MIRSMTAYGKGEDHREGMNFSAEIRSLNHRYRDIVLRIPRNFQELENDLRSLVASRTSRGRIEASLGVEIEGAGETERLELNRPMVDSYMRIFDQLAEQYGLSRDVGIDTLCGLKDVIVERPLELDVEQVRFGFEEALSRALDAMNEMRESEGQSIEADFLKRLGLLEQFADQVEERRSEVVAAYRDRLGKRVQEMLQALDLEADQDRLAQEVALFADKSDITEELVRLRSHIEQFRRNLSSDEAVGRKLDFLVQEMNREVNTLSAKASDATISRVVVEMKAELEKLREQAQNVE